MRAAGGERIRGVTPFGYDVDGKHLKINEEKADIVRLIFKLRYKAEYSTINIAEALNHMAIPTIRPGKPWNHSKIKRILDNERYFGYQIYEGVNYGQIMPAILNEQYAEWKLAFEQKYEGRRLSPRKLYIS